ncbi:hypothetical protein CBER1_04170 [Cercospora berteroae]|uniref:Glycosyl hydrolase family 13 catalytic domain-containing protein n=1 Tax=Cercospora berteroae TaxID=357750 RepID=A0A2S6CN37_9PEZI|nr:hypothetical protein CBER1_04170 [Cercospora berteroae]
MWQSSTLVTHERTQNLYLSKFICWVGDVHYGLRDSWRSQSIYQVLTDRFALTNGSTTQPCGWGNYCGGTWQGIVNKLDYIKGMGFTAVWISPVVENIPNSRYGQPYHGYWAQNIYALNTNYGTQEDLKALSAALHARGMASLSSAESNAGADV